VASLSPDGVARLLRECDSHSHNVFLLKLMPCVFHPLGHPSWTSIEHFQEGNFVDEFGREIGDSELERFPISSHVSVAHDNCRVVRNFKDICHLRWAWTTADLCRDIWSHACCIDICMESALLCSFQTVTCDACDLRFFFHDKSDSASDLQQSLSQSCGIFTLGIFCCPVSRYKAYKTAETEKP